MFRWPKHIFSNFKDLLRIIGYKNPLSALFVPLESSQFFQKAKEIGFREVRGDIFPVVWKNRIPFPGRKIPFQNIKGRPFT